MRILSEVLEEIIKLIPCGEESLIATLRDVKSSSIFASPEMQQHWWREAAEEFNDQFPEDLNDFKEWQRGIIEIWLEEKWETIIKEEEKKYDQFNY